MSREVRIPFQHPLSPDDPILDVVTAARKSPELTAEERQVAEAVAYQALRRGTVRVAELVEELESARAPELVDEARRAAGLPSLSEAAARRSLALAQRDDPPVRQQGPPRDHRGEAVQECAHPDCTRLSVNEVTKVVGPVAARRWHCPKHESEAAEGDMDAWTPPPISYAPGGGFMSAEQAADEAAYYERLVRESREKALRRQAQNRAQRERLAHLQELRDREARPINIGGIEIDGKGRIVNGPEQG